MSLMKRVRAALSPEISGILRSPAGGRLKRLGDDTVMCILTKKFYRIHDNIFCLYDLVDVDPKLERDRPYFENSSADTQSSAIDLDSIRHVEIYNRAKYINTEFMFQCLTYDDVSKRRIVEVGTGDAKLIARFANLGFDSYAVDYYTTEMKKNYFLHIADGGRPFTLISAPMSRLPLLGNSIDLLYLHAALHHALPRDPKSFAWSSSTNLHDTLAEIGRVLKSGPNAGAFFLLGEGVYPEDVTDRNFERACQTEGVVYESWYKISEYESAFRATGVYPTLWVDQVGLRMRAFCYDAAGSRIDVVTLDDQITDGGYDRFISVARSRTGDRFDAIWPDWIKVRS